MQLSGGQQQRVAIAPGPGDNPRIVAAAESCMGRCLLRLSKSTFQAAMARRRRSRAERTAVKSWGVRRFAATVSFGSKLKN